MSNNFDCCSYGIGVCADVHYSNWCSRERFGENFECLCRDSRGDGRAYFYTDWQNINYEKTIPTTVGDLICISNLVDGKIPDVESLLRLGEVMNECDGNWWYSDDELTEKWEENKDEFSQEIIDELLGLDVKYIENVLQYDCCNLKEGITAYETRGYCQGDVATVYINWNFLNEIWGSDVKFTSDGMSGLTLSDRGTIKTLHNDIDNYFWDAPFDGYITLIYGKDKVELDVGECVENEYDWDKEHVVSEVMTVARAKFKYLDESLFNLLKQDLIRLLPEDPAYK